MQPIADKLLEDTGCPGSSFHYDLVTWLESLSPRAIGELFGDRGINHLPRDKMTLKQLEQLTVELSWKSSLFEGNTYTLLDTQLLLTEGIKAKNRTEFETQMLLNHKNAIEFIMQNKHMFKDKVIFSTVEELHRIIGYNLGIKAGIRKKSVRITASNYTPIANPHQLREYADRTLAVISQATDPFSRALLALALIPYLQPFEDGNKRTGRMLDNALLIHSLGHGFSLRRTDARSLALAYLSFYAFSSIRALAGILRDELSGAAR